MFIKKPIYELPLKRDYVSHWGFIEAVRELFQNAIDGGSDWSWELKQLEPANAKVFYYRLRITSPNVRLPASCLVLGESSKRSDDSKIGAFGEGFKLALLVLCRLGIPVQLFNDDKCWEPTFTHSETFDTEVFAIRETRVVEHALKGLEYVIDQITLEQVYALQDAFRFLRKDKPQISYHVRQGEIFLEDQSALYVAGLFICATKLKYSYDLMPGVIQLERDRQTVADFELQWLAKDMWLETQQWDHLAKMIEAEEKDVEYIHYNCPELLKETVYKQFLTNNPGGIMAHSMEQMQELVKRGMEKVVYVGGAYGSIVCTAQPDRIAKQLERPSPVEVLQTFLRDNRQYMRTPAIVAMKEVIKNAANWRG